MSNRIDKLRNALQTAELDAVLVSDPLHIRYLTGFSGDSGWVLVGPETVFLITDFRYEEQARIESPDLDLLIAKNGFAEKMAELSPHRTGHRVGFEENHLPCKAFRKLTEQLSWAEWIARDGLVESLAILKDPGEIACIREAVRIGDRVFEQILPLLKPGISERDIAAEIDYAIRRQTAEGPSFQAIVASGPHASMPHASVSERALQSGDLVILDFGAVFHGYASDMTRTLVIGAPTVQQRAVHQIVLQAQETAIAAARAGLPCAELDRIARTIIEDACYGPQFGHSLGHGIGLCVHEQPNLSAKSDQVLAPGMVVTIEPGIYIPGWGGIRIEDLVIIRQNDCENLTTAPKQLQSM
ncbi:MAG: Xaa-Pro peptidase family protein [Candidatus Latescibacterota bacterium]